MQQENRRLLSLMANRKDASMNNGIYTAYSGLRAQVDALDLVANNLANANTTGFKEEIAYFYALDPRAEDSTSSNDLSGTINRSVGVRGALNATEGSITQTHRDLDIAIDGNGLLAVQTPRGVRYTRNGNLKLNEKGLLCASEGSPILGSKGKPIALGTGRIQIGEDGSVLLNDQKVDSMKVVTFNDLKNLVREGNSLFLIPEGKDQEKISNAKVKSGYLEQSNVNPVSSIVRMVEILRQFESIQKTINLVMNEINTKSIEKLGR